MSGQRRDFFLEASVPHVSLREAAEAFRDTFGCAYEEADAAGGYGSKVSGVIAALWQCREALEGLAADCRHAAWVIRAHRSSGVGPDQRVEAMKLFGVVVQWLYLAKFPERDVLALIKCVTHDCTCGGCDLVNGERLHRIADEFTAAKGIRRVQTWAEFAALEGRLA
jgi:hypothetical protein